MHSQLSQSRQAPSPGLKQVKVDNWGAFFLQRLQQLYAEEELLDLTIKFPTSDITVQAHRLVVTTCTDYFLQLEQSQKDREDYTGTLIMPSDMPYECVKSIISFMYTGQLEYWTSEQNALYKTAQKMNMAVLTKVLDAQLGTPPPPILTTTSPPSPPQTTPVPTHPMVNEKKIISLPNQSSLLRKASSHQELPTTTLPGRKLPIWRRKIDTPSSSSSSSSLMNDSTSYGKRKNQATSGPSRFDLPEVEDFALGVFSSFDDITYNTKPIAQAQKQDKDESADMSYNRSDMDNQKNDTTEDEDDDMKNEKSWENSDDDWSGPKGILRDPDVQPSPAKRVRFELEEKENVEKKKKNSQNTVDSIDNHAKIIREVLKKYPHLVKNNKNIRLKIMQKEGKSNETNASGKTKVSYVVLKSDHLMSGNMDDNQGERSSSGGGQHPEPGENGPWKCYKCDIGEEYKSYYMYRRHMQDVHNEKFDPRVCEHCGYKATKRNMLMYHLYTQHNIPPPKNMSFPKCHACNYVALSENLLVRHQINHNHRKTVRSLEEVQCAQCHLTFKDVNDLASHEMTTGHGSILNGKEQKGYRCPHCSKLFVRPTNLQVHIDCAHKNLRENDDLLMQNITLEPSSEAEALSTVASGIAASLGVGSDALVVDHHHQQEQQQQQQHGIITTIGQDGYLVPEIDVNHLTQATSYNGHEIVEGQQMIMLIDNETYQNQLEGHHQQQQQQQPQQLEISSNEQLVMQGTDEGMIVYIADNEGGRHEQIEHQVYETYHQVDNVNQQIDENNQVIEQEEREEVEEEVEEVFEEVEEVVEEVEEVVEEEESSETMDNNEVVEEEEEGGGEQIEEEIHYVEETEIVEFDEEQGEHQQGQSMMIIEEEHLESQDVVNPDDSNKQKQTSTLAAEWDESSTEINES